MCTTQPHSMVGVARFMSFGFWRVFAAFPLPTDNTNGSGVSCNKTVVGGSVLCSPCRYTRLWEDYRKSPHLAVKYEEAASHME